MASFPSRRSLLSLLLAGTSSSLLVVACARDLDRSNGGFETVDSRRDGSIEEDPIDDGIPRQDGSTIPNPGIPDASGDGSSSDGGACVVADGGTVDFALVTVGQELSKPVAIPATPTAPPFTAPGVCPITTGVASTSRGYQTFRVQNRTGQATSLSAWAVCPDLDTDVFLSVYRGSSVPMTEAERRACPTGTVLSNGKSSVADGGYDSPSPESDGGRYCPSLMKARGHALTLAPCEEAILYLQSFYDTAPDGGHPAPTMLKVKAE